MPGFDPQALTSLTGLSSLALSIHQSFDPQALTSLTRKASRIWPGIQMFRSTGSYEPDQWFDRMKADHRGFDPQALTSLTTMKL